MLHSIHHWHKLVEISFEKAWLNWVTAFSHYHSTCGFVGQFLEHVLEVLTEVLYAVLLLWGHVFHRIMKFDGAFVSTAAPLGIVHITNGGYDITSVWPRAVLLGRCCPLKEKKMILWIFLNKINVKQWGKLEWMFIDLNDNIYFL